MRTPQSIQLLKQLGASLGKPSDAWALKAKEQLLVNGYGDSGDIRQAVAEALQAGAEVVSKKTGCVWLSHGLPHVPPAYIRPGKLRVGDRAIVLNWVPLGVHGATIDLSPKVGKVAKLLVVKCKIAGGPVPYDRWPMEMPQVFDEKRVYALGLEGDQGVTPICLKDYSLVMRLDGPSALPSGESRVMV